MIVGEGELPRLTPGRLTALWVVLQTLQKLGGRVATREALSFASRTSLRSGGLPITDGYALGLRGGFIREVGPQAEPTDLGMRALRLSTEDEPDMQVQRLFVSVLLLRLPSPWVAYWQGDPSSLELVLPEAEKAALRAAGLFPLRDNAALLEREWWRALSIVPVPEATTAQRKAIGDAGEELTVQYERRRLTDEGFPDLAEEVCWVGQESPAYGFDVASFEGRLRETRSPKSPLAIEVKSVAHPVSETFPFHLTVHEWDTAVDLRDSYAFHLWDGVRSVPIPVARTDAPKLVDPSELTGHLAGPSPCGNGCKWESMYIELHV